MDEALMMTTAGGRWISLARSASDGTFLVREVVRVEMETSVLTYAENVVEFDDAKLVFDRHAKLLLDNVGHEVKGE